MTLKEKAVEMVGTISKNDSGIGYNYFEALLDKKDSDYTILKSKLDNLIILMEEVDSKGEMKEFGELDFETEIWEMI